MWDQLHEVILAQSHGHGPGLDSASEHASYRPGHKLEAHRPRGLCAFATAVARLACWWWLILWPGQWIHLFPFVFVSSLPLLAWKFFAFYHVSVCSLVNSLYPRKQYHKNRPGLCFWCDGKHTAPLLKYFLKVKSSSFRYTISIYLYFRDTCWKFTDKWTLGVEGPLGHRSRWGCGSGVGRRFL